MSTHGGGDARPYLLTGGRAVRPGDLGMEAVVLTVASDPTERLERRAILDLAVEPLSVAELAARLGLHLGVVRVLVTELHAAGLLTVQHAPVADVGMLREVLSGLRDLA